MKTLLWLNVDPKAEKYPHESSYMYCGNNPVAFVDPDGMDRIYSSSGRFIKDTGIGSKIMVETKHGLRYLSGLDYSSRGTRKAVSRVIANEAHLRGYTLEIWRKKVQVHILIRQIPFGQIVSN